MAGQCILRGFFSAEILYDPSRESEVKHPGTVLIFPGGGYNHLSARESGPVQDAFYKAGYRAAVFNYSVSDAPLGLRPLKEAAYAAGRIRQLFSGPLYFCGFSAGAHLAASLGVHWDDSDWEGGELFPEVYKALKQRPIVIDDHSDLSLKAEKLEENLLPTDLRPDGMILCYPVITSGVYAHEGSFERLLGTERAYVEKYGDPTGYRRARQWFSLETAVHDTTPPCFLWQTAEDQSVPVENSLLFAESLIRAGISPELHIYPRGKHGMSLAVSEVCPAESGFKADPHVADWFRLATQWLAYTFEQDEEREE